ncbi:MAG: hypothetical protein B1H11_11860 [Desulfobacteraceae bacterium 4484_190.1]|nr:MAG: hypothetical protein B1H11_11860 [Desulfobacteraceae bacterium 4484_190.1]
MKKDINYYMGLPYTIEVVPIPVDEGGGFTARLPDVGRFAITGDGESPEEAIRNLLKAQRERFEEYLKRGLEIPEPKEEKEEYSGRFLVRLPRILHHQIASEARKNGISLNQYVNYLLATNLERDRQEQQFTHIINEIEAVQDVIWDFIVSPHIYDIGEVYKETEKGRKEAAIYKFPEVKAA